VVTEKRSTLLLQPGKGLFCPSCPLQGRKEPVCPCETGREIRNPAAEKRNGFVQRRRRRRGPAVPQPGQGWAHPLLAAGSASPPWHPPGEPAPRGRGKSQFAAKVLAGGGTGAEGPFTALRWSWLLGARRCLHPTQRGLSRLGQGQSQQQPWHEAAVPVPRTALGSTETASKALSASPRNRPSSIFAIFSKAGTVCCLWDVRYPGPAAGRGKSQASRGGRRAELGPAPGARPRGGGDTAASGRDDHGDDASHGLGSTAVLARPHWGGTTAGRPGLLPAAVPTPPWPKPPVTPRIAPAGTVTALAEHT